MLSTWLGDGLLIFSYSKPVLEVASQRYQTHNGFFGVIAASTLFLTIKRFIISEFKFPKGDTLTQYSLKYLIFPSKLVLCGRVPSEAAHIKTLRSHHNRSYVQKPLPGTRSSLHLNPITDAVVLYKAWATMSLTHAKQRVRNAEYSNIPIWEIRLLMTRGNNSLLLLKDKTVIYIANTLSIFYWKLFPINQ